MIKEMRWERVAKMVDEIYGGDFTTNWEDRYFHCAECEEPILEEDYPYLEVIDGEVICPICEEVIADER